MKGTMSQTTVLNPATAGRERGPTGISYFATQAPIYTPPSTGHAFGQGQETAGRNHRTAIIGAAALALIAAGFAGAAYIRAQETTAVVTSSQGTSVEMTVVPHGALAADLADAARITGVLPDGGAVVEMTVVPHGALAADLN